MTSDSPPQATTKEDSTQNSETTPSTETYRFSLMPHGFVDEYRKGICDYSPEVAALIDAASPLYGGDAMEMDAIVTYHKQMTDTERAAMTPDKFRQAGLSAAISVQVAAFRPPPSHLSERQRELIRSERQMIEQKLREANRDIKRGQHTCTVLAKAITEKKQQENSADQQREHIDQRMKQIEQRWLKVRDRFSQKLRKSKEIDDARYERKLRRDMGKDFRESERLKRARRELRRRRGNIDEIASEKRRYELEQDELELSQHRKMLEDAKRQVKRLQREAKNHRAWADWAKSDGHEA